MLDKDEIMINSYAQEKNNLEDVLVWFESLNSEEKLKTLYTLKFCLHQCHPKKETVENAIKLVPLKQTVTPIVLLKTKGFEEALDKIVKLPEDERRKAFITLITVFKVADTIRRKTQCKKGCFHEWHNME
ncbi:hypothetical protein FLACHUCJ7_04561 [Flavobacterium chungangense]|uniref:Uncharacterized protein n=2 Tax=Flavobacterium chungangense TaxID=554283 RepID=A0A6V6ZDP6_9FLAO|nr:hypothetical protein FLACHUCJ7_04561 [Flavobacterium chungangense]